MALSSVLGIGKFFEWYTEVPFVNRPRESPTFVIQNTECFLYFKRDASYYYIYLKPKDGSVKLKPFSLTIYMLYNNGSDCFEKSESKFSHKDTYLYYFDESRFAKQPISFSDGVSVRFLFLFQNNAVEPLLPSGKNIAEMSTQASLVSDVDIQILSQDFDVLWKTRDDHSDFNILCNGKTIGVHKAVLRARSKYFAHLFSKDTEENINHLINMSTTDLSVMELCLEFIYTGKISKLPIEMVTNLYVLGHAWEIPSLIMMCADLMISNICEDNYIDYLVLADQKNDYYFKEKVIDYISDHTDLLKSEKWEKFSHTHMITAIDVYQKCMFK